MSRTRSPGPEGAALGEDYVLTLSCPDAHGIVHAVSGFLLDADCNITESQQYGDATSQRFFMRVAFRSGQPTEAETLRAGFEPVARRLEMEWELVGAHARPRTLIMVSGLGHCLNDLLFRHASDHLRIDLRGVVSNHRDFEGLVDRAGIPFHHVPVEKDRKGDAEDRLLDLVAAEDVELVVLARYMQVLGAKVCDRLPGRIINIHHSLLPSFKGANPYRQAHAHGVKLVGATAHYVTPDLDEGPIIEQDIERVDHSADIAALTAAGRDIECRVLARAVGWHTEHRVLVNGRRTVVFRA